MAHSLTRAGRGGGGPVPAVGRAGVIGMDELWVPYRRHAATFVVGVMPLFALALVGAATGSTVLTIAPLAVAVTPVAIAGILWFVCRSWDRRLDRLASESPLLLDWTLDGDAWRQLLAERGRQVGAAGGMLAGLFAGAGLLIGALLAADGEEIAGSAALMWGVPAAIGGLVGGWVWFLAWRNGVATRREQLRRGGRVLLGRHGFYLTGEYRPLAGMSQRLTDVRCAEVGGRLRLVLTWHVASGRYSSDQRVEVPVPAGREAEARRVVELLTGGGAGAPA